MTKDAMEKVINLVFKLVQLGYFFNQLTSTSYHCTKLLAEKDFLVVKSSTRNLSRVFFSVSLPRAAKKELETKEETSPYHDDARLYSHLMLI